MPGTRDPLITVCVPTIGRTEFLFQTLQSLERQTLQNYELILLDNASPSDVREMLAQYASRNPRARIVRSDERIPMFRNFNLGIANAKGQYITFFHDDDLYEPTFLEETTKQLSLHWKAAFAGSNYFIIDGDGNIQGVRKLVRRTHAQDGDTFIRLLVKRGRSTVPTPGIVFRKSAFDERGFDESLSIHWGDFIMFMRMAEKHEIVLIEKPLMRLRLHGGNASNIPMSNSAPLQHRLVNAYINDFEQRSPRRRPFAIELRDLADAAGRRGLLWGWISADDPKEAAACLQAFRGMGGAPFIAGVLSRLESIGFRSQHRAGLTAFVRRLGRSVG